DLEALLTLEIFFVGLKLTLELRDPIVSLAHLLVEQVPLVFEVRELAFFVADRALGGENFNSAPGRFFMRAFVAAARFFDRAHRGLKFLLCPIACSDGCVALCVEPFAFRLKPSDDCFSPEHRIAHSRRRSTENYSCGR